MRSLFAIAALLASVLANAGILTGEKLKDFCNADGDNFEKKVIYDAGCVSYVTGVWDTHGMMMVDPENPDDPRRGGYCKPKGVSGKQLGAIVGKYLAEHPEGWHYNASASVILAFNEAFPCD